MNISNEYISRAEDVADVVRYKIFLKINSLQFVFIRKKATYNLREISL